MCHFRRNTLASEIAACNRVPIYQERRVHLVRCSAMLVDLRARCAAESRLLDPEDYSYCQALGAQLRTASLPGVLTRSARDSRGEIVSIFQRNALSDPRDACYLIYMLDAATGRVTVERRPGKVECIRPVFLLITHNFRPQDDGVTGSH